VLGMKILRLPTGESRQVLIEITYQAYLLGKVEDEASKFMSVLIN
jgi:hypothetical protein